MYSEYNNLPSIIETATKFVMDNDRLLYREYFEAAENFVIEKKLVLGGTVGKALISSIPININSFSFDIYTTEANNDATELSNIFNEIETAHVPAHYVVKRTNIMHRELTIEVNTRKIFKIYRMDPDMMSCVVKRKGYFSEKELCVLDIEHYLFQSYKHMYTPSKFSDLANIIIDESTLYTNYINGLDLTNSTFKPMYESDRIKKCRNAIISKYVSGSDRIIVGDLALKELAPDYQSVYSHLQLITAEDIDDVFKAIEKVVKEVSSSIEIMNKKINLRLPMDLLITKHIFYISVDKKWIPLIDIYNNTTYEILPVVEVSKVKYGNVFVNMCFKMLDIIVLKSMQKRNINIGNRLSTTINDLAALRNVAQKTSTDKLFGANPKKYVGVFYTERVAKKQYVDDIMKGMQKGFKLPVYIPELKREMED